MRIRWWRTDADRGSVSSSGVKTDPAWVARPSSFKQHQCGCSELHPKTAEITEGQPEKQWVTKVSFSHTLSVCCCNNINADNPSAGTCYLILLFDSQRCFPLTWVWQTHDLTQSADASGENVRLRNSDLLSFLTESEQIRAKEVLVLLRKSGMVLWESTKGSKSSHADLK